MRVSAGGLWQTASAMALGLFDRVVAGVYDRFMETTERHGLRERRRQLLAGADGDVLEIGAGTGANLQFHSERWTSDRLTEPSPAMASKLRAKLVALGREAEVIEAPAESLPLPDESVDTVISTLVLCTVKDLDGALAEIRRVLRPGGRLLFIEHVRSDDADRARKQDRWARVWKVVGNGCVCNRETAAAIERAGFEIEQIEHGRMPKAHEIVRPLIQGVARRP